MTLETSDGRLVIVSGKSRSGKTAWTAKEVGKLQRVIAWDPEDQWSKLPGFKRITSKPELLAAIQKAGGARLAFVSGGDLKTGFDFWAGAAYYWGRYHGGAVAVAEELADVTTPGKAPGNWGVLIRRGLKRGITIYALSQRWAEADKTAFGNASEYVIFTSASKLDIEYLSKRTRLEPGLLADLKPLDYVRYNPDTGSMQRDRLAFRKRNRAI